MLAAALLAGCGGDTITVEFLEGPPNPDASVQLTEDNAHAAMALHAYATESLLHLSTFGVDLLVRTAESGETQATLPCDAGFVRVTINDADEDGLPSAADTALFEVVDCRFDDTGYTSSGNVELLIRNFFACSNAYSRAKF